MAIPGVYTPKRTRGYYLGFKVKNLMMMFIKIPSVNCSSVGAFYTIT